MRKYRINEEELKKLISNSIDNALYPDKISYQGWNPVSAENIDKALYSKFLKIENAVHEIETNVNNCLEELEEKRNESPNEITGSFYTRCQNEVEQVLNNAKEISKRLQNVRRLINGEHISKEPTINISK